MLIGMSLDLTGRLLASVSPVALFANGEVGVWYDPSDLTTLFTDSAGTTPVTTPGQTVGLMLDKSQGLVLGSELVTNGSFTTDTDWTKGAGWTISGGAANASSASGILLQAVAVVSGRSYRVSWTASFTGGNFQLPGSACNNNG